MIILSSPQQRRDVSVALVGFTSWAAVAWKLTRVAQPSAATEALLAVVGSGRHSPTAAALHALPCSRCSRLAWDGNGHWLAWFHASLSPYPFPNAAARPQHHTNRQAAALMCLWPLALALAPPPSYARWREWLVPAHLALQHWVGLRFALPLEAQPLLVSGSAEPAADSAPVHSCRVLRLGLSKPSPTCCRRAARMLRCAVQGAPSWAARVLPVFLASFCQPWLYLVRSRCAAARRS